MGNGPRNVKRHAARSENRPPAKIKAKPNPEQKVIQMLTGNNNPLVSIIVVYPNTTRGSFSYPRSMGFMIERMGPKNRLIITCRHALEKRNEPHSQLIISFKSPNPMMLTCVGEPIYDTEAESDIAFLVVQDLSDSPTKPFDLSQSDPVIQNEMTLWNAQNQCNPFEQIYAVPASRQQPVREMDHIAFYKFSSPFVHRIPMTDTVQRRKYKEEGWHECRLLQMASRPSYSGSPIWDNELRLYGMDIRGSTPEKNPELGDQLVCIPNSALLAARQRVNESILARLKKTQ